MKQQRAIDLGKQLVEHLGGRRDTDILIRWMAHYIGEQIVTCETSTGQKKVEAEERCFRTILALWEKRNHFPDGLRPLKGFEAIFRSLSFLDLEDPKPYYLRSIRGERPTKNKQDQEADRFFEFVMSVDSAARSLVAMGMQTAITKAATKKTRALLNQARLLQMDEDVDIALRLDHAHGLDAQNSTHSIEKHIEKIERYVANIDHFCAACESVRPHFVKEIENLKSARDKLKKKKRRKV